MTRLAAALIVLFVSLGSLAAQEVATLPPLDDLEPAVAGQLRDARQQLDRIVAGRATRRNQAEAYGDFAQVLHAYEFFDAAEAAYRTAVRLTPDEPKWLYLLGYLYQQTGRLEESADRFRAVLRVQPNDRTAAVRLGVVCLGLNRLREARDQFQSALATFPATAHNGLGEVALREGRYDEAISHFRSALERAPQATAIHYSLAMAYRSLGRLDDARAQLQRRGPGEVRQADPIVDRLQTLIRGERLLIIQGSRAFDAGRFQDAADAFTRAIAVAPESLAAHRALASTLVRLGREDEAIEGLTRARSFAPDDEETVVSLSILLSHRERYREAIALLDDAQRRWPQRTATATTLSRLLASSPDLSLRNGSRALAIALAVYDSNPLPAYAETMALALAELERCGEALEWMRRATADAARTGDTAEVTRLTAETPKYETASCRPPGR